MTDMPKGQALLGQRALVLGIANEHSIAYGCAKVFRALGAELAITYLNEKAKPYVEPLARDLGAAIIVPCDVGKEGELEAVFNRIAETWGGLDIALHSIAFALKEDLQGPLLDSSSEGFKVAMDISCHSFIRMARLAAPLMPEGGRLLAMTYHGANKVVPNYNLMGPVKAALESAVRYLAYELGDKHIRDGARCKDVFFRQGTAINFARPGAATRDGILVVGTRIRDPKNACTISKTREVGETQTLLLTCFSGLLVPKISFSIRFQDEDTVVRTFSDFPDEKTTFRRCRV